MTKDMMQDMSNDIKKANTNLWYLRLIMAIPFEMNDYGWVLWLLFAPKSKSCRYEPSQCNTQYCKFKCCKTACNMADKAAIFITYSIRAVFISVIAKIVSDFTFLLYFLRLPQPRIRCFKPKTRWTLMLLSTTRAFKAKNSGHISNSTFLEALGWFPVHAIVSTTHTAFSIF